MADTFGLEIYASNKLAFAGRAKTLTIPAVDGEQAFLAQHENIVAAIIPGEMRTSRGWWFVALRMWTLCPPCCHRRK